MPPTRIEPGDVFGRLTVVERATGGAPGGGLGWVCTCTCGNTATIASRGLTTGMTQSCGCLQREGRKRGAAKSATRRSKRRTANLAGNAAQSPLAGLLAQAVATAMTEGAMSPDQFIAARTKLGVSQGAVAAWFGVGTNAVYRWESGTSNKVPAWAALLMRLLTADKEADPEGQLVTVDLKFGLSYIYLAGRIEPGGAKTQLLVPPDNTKIVLDFDTLGHLIGVELLEHVLLHPRLRARAEIVETPQGGPDRDRPVY